MAKFSWIFVECEMKPRQFIFSHWVRTLFWCFIYGLLHGESVMSTNKTTTATTSTIYFILKLHFIIAIISINSIFTWHLARLHCVAHSMILAVMYPQTMYYCVKYSFAFNILAQRECSKHCTEFHWKQCSTHKIALRKADKSTKDVKNSTQCELHERFFHSHNVRLRENKS